MSEQDKSCFEIDHKRDEDLPSITMKEFLEIDSIKGMSEAAIESAKLYNKETGEVVLEMGSPVDLTRGLIRGTSKDGKIKFMTESEHLLKRVYQVACKLDTSLIETLDGKGNLTGIEYEKIMDVLIEAEEYMKKNHIEF